MSVPTSRREPSAFVVSITPFTATGEFDEPGIRSHLRRLGEAGIGIYLGGGGSGEGYVLSPDETRRLLEISAEELSGTVPVRAMGVEPRAAGEMIRYIEMARRCGVDAAQVYSLDPGHGHRPTSKEIHAYFDDVLSATDLPVVLSTHQSVGYQVPVDLLADLAGRYPHLIGINSSHQDPGYLAAIIDAVGARLDVHVGGPHQALTAWSLGATGFLCSEGNLAPRLCMAVVDSYRRGDTPALMETFGKVLRLSGTFYGAGGIRATKAVLGRFGLAGGAPRRPQLPVDDATLDRLVDMVRAFGIPAIEGWPAS